MTVKSRSVARVNPKRCGLFGQQAARDESQAVEEHDQADVDLAGQKSNSEVAQRGGLR